MKGDRNSIRISVRSLVEFLLRSGSLESRSGPSSEAAMLEGARIHRALQKKAGSGYRAEVPLRLEIPLAGEGKENLAGTTPMLCLEGRADGIYCADHSREAELEDGLWTIDEIKTVFGSVRGMTGPEEVHLAQARCYAYIYAHQEGLERIGIRMTYCSQVTGEVQFFYETRSFAELESWFAELIHGYEPWALMRLSGLAQRQETIREMKFPFPYRKGQYDLAAGVYRTIARGRKLFLQAPTGTGKTMAVLFPALKAVGEEKADRIWYLTAKAVTGRAALEAVAILREQGLRIRSVVLASKERVCPEEAVDCRAAACSRADGHFDRVNAALWELLQEASDGVPMTTQRIADVALKHCVCPYELAMDAADFADVIVGDYHYVFHPQARLDRFLESGRQVLLVDEAHNLLERGREMYSADLSYAEVRRFRALTKTEQPRLWKKLRELVQVLRALDRMTAEDGGTAKKEAGKYHLLTEWEEDREKLARALETAGNEIQWILEQEERSAALYSVDPDHDFRQELLEFYFDLIRFQKTLEKEDEHYIVYTTGRGTGGRGTGGRARGTALKEPLKESLMESPKEQADQEGKESRKTGGFTLHLFCADPSGRLREYMEKTASAVFFSATFLPIQYYKGLLGGTAEDYEMYARSAFLPEQQAVVIAGDVTSRYRDRNEETFRRIADRIGHIIGCRPGNYMVYFPSYAFLEKVQEAFESILEEQGAAAFSPMPVRLLTQTRGMEDAEKEAFLEEFEETDATRHLVGFCVMGGMFGEGVDLRSDRLIGSIVVGTGIPPVEPQRELLRAYFSGMGENGYDFAYRFPGMNKVLQAAGRVIRTETDRGIVALLDERFGEAANRELFPVEWGQPEVTEGEQTISLIRRFWCSSDE